MRYEYENGQFYFEDILVNNSLEVVALNDQEWYNLLAKITPAIDEKKEASAKRMALAAEKQKADMLAQALRDKEENDKRLKLAEEEKLNQSTDKAKFKVVAATLISIKIPEMKSRKAQKLHVEVRGMIDKIVEHINTSI